MSAIRRLFDQSPARGWRWFFTFFGALAFVAVILGVGQDIAETAPKDMPILIFPALIVVAGAWLLYFGLTADDNRVLRVVTFLRAWRR